MISGIDSLSSLQIAEVSDGRVFLQRRNLHSCTGEKGSCWSGYSHPSTYSDQRFSGGMISGRVRGAVITTDLTTICDGDFEAATEVRNSEEASCAKCLLKTDMDVLLRSMNFS